MSNIFESRSTGLTTSAQATLTFTVSQAIPVGTLLVGTFNATVDVAPPPPGSQFTVTDSRGNVWAIDVVCPITGQTTSVFLMSCIVTTAYQTGDTIVVNANPTVTRLVGVIEYFDTPVNSIKGAGAFSDNGGASTTTPKTADLVAARTGALVVVAFGFINSGRTFTPPVGWTMGQKVTSTAASPVRAAQVGWTYSTADNQTITPTATASSSGIFGTVAKIYEPPVPAVGDVGTVVVTGQAAKPVTSRAVIIGGVPRPVISRAVIVGGTLRPLL